MGGVAHHPGALFAEDFDMPATEAAEAPVVEPVYSARELAAAREASWRDGHDAGLHEAAAGDAAATAAAVRSVAERFAAEGDAVAAQVEQSAEEIARL